jgi:hypothetical protein
LDTVEDWIHIEYGPDARWIVRLVRFTRLPAQSSEAKLPEESAWKFQELYRADREDDPVDLSTAYAQAWLYSRRSWPKPPRR